MLEHPKKKKWIFGNTTVVTSVTQIAYVPMFMVSFMKFFPYLHLEQKTQFWIL